MQTPLVERPNSDRKHIVTIKCHQKFCSPKKIYFEKGSFAAVGRGQGSADVVGELLPVPAKPHGLVLVVRVQQMVAFLSAIPSPGIVLVRCTAIRYVLPEFEIAMQNNRKPRAGQPEAPRCFYLANSFSNSLQHARIREH